MSKTSKSQKGRSKSVGDSNEDLLDDPFFDFGGHNEHLRHMDQFFRDPFAGFGGGLLAIDDGSRMHSRRQQQQAQNMQVADRGLFMDPFAHFGSMFSNMRSMMSDMHRAFEQTANDPNAHVYQHSSVMTFSNTGSGAPKIYQASSSSIQGPGGIKETRKAVKDSEAGIEKCAVGHHIRDRAHIIERSRNSKTGEEHENQELINLDDEEAQPFDQEYQEKWRSTMKGIDQRRRLERSRYAPVGDSSHRSRHAALPESESTRRPRKSSTRKD